MRAGNWLLRVGSATAPVCGTGLVVVVVAGVLPPTFGWALVAALSATTMLLHTYPLGAFASRLVTGTRALAGADRAVLAPAVTLMCRAGLGPPVVGLVLRARPTGVLAQPLGRAGVALPSGLVAGVHRGTVTPEQAAATLCAAAATARAGLDTGGPALTLWRLPWTLALAACRPVRRWPVLRLAWQTRAVVVAVSVVQLAVGQQTGLALLVGALGVASYLLPAAERALARRAEQAGDDAVVGIGLGRDYLELLHRSGAAISVERWSRLTTDATTPAPSERAGVLVPSPR